jgi:hypothetical protein
LHIHSNKIASFLQNKLKNDFMKKTLIFLLLLLGLENAFAQDNRKKGKADKFYGKSCSQIGLGWNYNLPNLQGFNYILERFNQTRSISNGFSPIENLQGPSGAFTFYGTTNNGKFTRYLFEIGYNLGWNRQTTKDGNTDLTMKFNSHSAHLRFGTLPVLTPNFDIGLGVGVDARLIDIRTAEGTIQLESIQQSVGVGASVFLPIFIGFGRKSPIALGIRPYYQLQFQTIDFSGFNQKINPQTYTADPADAQKSRFNNYGVEFQLIYVFSKIIYTSNPKNKKK